MRRSVIKSVLIFLSASVCSLFAAEKLDCVSCHADISANWQQSDHAKSMQLADSETVLGDFNNAVVEHYSQHAKFYIEDEQFKAELSVGDQTNRFTIDYTFGHYPLQQYLVATDGGRYQVFPFAWDSRDKADGGQRWYANYETEDIQSADRLHWQQPLQNWNGMCADCHSSGFTRKYSLEENAFDSSWDTINVSCQSCHGEMQAHDSVTEPSIKGAWVLAEGEKIASWQGEPRDNQFMDTCFACHALRSPLTDGFNASDAFLDQFSPSLLMPDLYHADGQIKEEDYVFGSFMQSKMFAAGVNCLDCHDAHTLKLKSESNGLCLQCHREETYQTEKHTFHPLDSSGGQCVDCHMPETRFMGVDDRRDHSFTIPKPHLTDEYNIPNACTSCHSDKDAAWATENTEKWYGKPQELSEAEQLYIDLQHYNGLPIEKHLFLINDKNLSAIKRATAISLLPLSTEILQDDQIKAWVQSSEPLIRLAVARVGFLLPVTERSKTYLTLLNDQYKAIRVDAVNQLIGVGLEQSAGFDQAFASLLIANETSSWRGEGSLKRSEVFAKQGNLQKSIAALEHAILVDPYLDVSYINLVDIYRQLGQKDKEAEVYEAGLNANPNSGMLHYVKGLSLIRQGDKPSSIQAFAKAVELQPTNPQFAYLYFLALDAVGKTSQTVTELRNIIARYSFDQKLGELGLSFSGKIQSKIDSEFFEHYLQNTPEPTKKPK